MYKLIAIDLDGTLLNSYGEISKQDKHAIKEAIQKGIKVILASGRTFSAIENYAQDLGATEYVVSGNGATIYDIQKNEIIYNKCLTKAKVLKIANICEENSVYYNVYADKSIIANSLNYNTLFYHCENLRKPEEKRTAIDIVENVPKYINGLNNEEFLKITVCDKDKSIFIGIINKLKQIKNVEILDVSHMSRKTIKYGTEEREIEYYYTEISNENVNKWSAIEYLIEKIGIDKSEVVAIGDNVNDKEMIQNAGLGIAMGNSFSELKGIADIVVTDNNSGGIAEAIYKII